MASSRDVSGSAIDSPAQNVTPVRSVVESATTGGSGPSPPATGVSIVTVLDYIRSTFSEEAALDSVSLDAAANPGAYHAWRAYRGPALPAQQPLSPVSSTSGEGSALGRNRRPGEWNWDGVWEERVKRAVKASLSESVLYGPGTGDDIIRFQQGDSETTSRIKRRLRSYKTFDKARPIFAEVDDKYLYGPLDDIINEIRGDIWESPHDYKAEASHLGWAAPLEVPSTWTVTPLPVSRLPSNQPLTIRKNRESRSSTSGSSMGDHMNFSRTSSNDNALNGGPVGAPASMGTAPWPLFDAPVSYEIAHAPDAPGNNAHTCNIEPAENLSQDADDRSVPTKRRPSVLRLFTGLSRLRRTDTGETSGSSGDASDLASPTRLETHNEDEVGVELSPEPSEDAVEAYVRKYARDGARLRSIMGRIARRLPSPIEHNNEGLGARGIASHGKALTTLRAVVRVFSGIAQLSQDEQQEFWVAVEIEGALHNRGLLPESSIDVIFVVDNAYYVSKECLGRALNAVNSALYHLDRSDRVALYTTHCTHQSVTGNRPDLLFPLGHFNTGTEETFRDLTASIAKCGTQSWKPPRPNPSMAEVILGVAKSLEDKAMSHRRTHVVLLSPTAHILHDVSKSCPHFYIHQINPAAIPFRRSPDDGDTNCMEECCKNVFISNWSQYQSLPGRIKRILEYARSVKPVGEISQVCVDLRARCGCEIVECSGNKDIASLRLGQVHTVFAKLRVTRSATKEVDLLSQNPIFNSSLNAKDLRQQLQNAAAVGAVKVHLFDVQVYHQNTLHGNDCWNYTETPFLIVHDLGGLAPPFDTALEVHKRQLFWNFIQLQTDEAKKEAEAFLSTLNDDQAPLEKLVQRILREVERYQQVLEYEQEHRQRLPLCPGPVAIEYSPHEWLMDVWSRRKTKRQGIAVVEEEEISGLIDGLHGLERLG
ncbi:hypothetical protein E8E12_006335 [Didymella heteroderae]|uniref:Uncharacterized protein n=1 Tax=Didymella heteroderae TaxID=1769908 RepID=A0A9P5BY51_9PLEO|nr:hypothetical protein E8E12_006335 [Didymella heteroderae]